VCLHWLTLSNTGSWAPPQTWGKQPQLYTHTDPHVLQCLHPHSMLANLVWSVTFHSSHPLQPKLLTAPATQVLVRTARKEARSLPHNCPIACRIQFTTSTCLDAMTACHLRQICQNLPLLILY
jgi:hypothetical protein